MYSNFNVKNIRGLLEFWVTFIKPTFLIFFKLIFKKFINYLFKIKQYSPLRNILPKIISCIPYCSPFMQLPLEWLIKRTHTLPLVLYIDACLSNAIAATQKEIPAFDIIPKLCALFSSDKKKHITRRPGPFFCCSISRIEYLSLQICKSLNRDLAARCASFVEHASRTECDSHI